MATYKVIQDIEAEDKLLGPLTLRQFIYAGVAAVCLYLAFLSLTKHALFLLAFFLPVALLAGFFAWPWNSNQPTEIWALAKIRFLLKPHRRIWNQSGVKELVSITAPKTVLTNYTNGLSQTEVSSRLKALADTIDSRGWVIKNANVNLGVQSVAGISTTGSDRLIDPSSFPQAVVNVDVQAADDILDEQNNPTAQHFDQMIQASTDSHRQQITQRLRKAASKFQQTSSIQAQPITPAPNDYWFLNQPQASAAPTGSVTFNSQVVAPGADSQIIAASSADEQALDQELKASNSEAVSAYPHLKVIQPLSEQKPTSTMPEPAPVNQAPAVSPQMTPPPNPAILNLANNNDLNVATLARQVNQPESKDIDQDEVVISLH